MEFKRLIRKLTDNERVEFADFKDNPKLKQLRDQIDQYISHKVHENYCSLDLSKEQSAKILSWEKKMIENCFNVYFKLDLKNVLEEQVQLIRAQLLMKAELMHEFRIKGKSFSPEKMKKLAKLMHNSLVINGMIELGELNEKLGIIKQGVDTIFPEYIQLCNELDELVQGVGTQKDGDYHEQN